MKHEPLQLSRRQHDTDDYKIEHREAMIEFRNSRDIETVSPEWRELLNDYIQSIQDNINTVGGRHIQMFERGKSRTTMASF